VPHIVALFYALRPDAATTTVSCRPAHDLKEQKDFTKEMPMCLPSELGRHVGAAQRSCGAVAKDCIDGERTLYRNSTVRARSSAIDHR